MNMSSWVTSVHSSNSPFDGLTDEDCADFTQAMLHSNTVSTPTPNDESSEIPAVVSAPTDPAFFFDFSDKGWDALEALFRIRLATIPLVRIQEARIERSLHPTLANFWGFKNHLPWRMSVIEDMMALISLLELRGTKEILWAYAPRSFFPEELSDLIATINVRWKEARNDPEVFLPAKERFVTLYARLGRTLEGLLFVAAATDTLLFKCRPFPLAHPITSMEEMGFSFLEFMATSAAWGQQGTFSRAQMIRDFENAGAAITPQCNTEIPEVPTTPYLQALRANAIGQSLSIVFSLASILGPLAPTLLAQDPEQAVDALDNGIDPSAVPHLGINLLGVALAKNLASYLTAPRKGLQAPKNSFHKSAVGFILRNPSEGSIALPWPTKLSLK